MVEILSNSGGNQWEKKTNLVTLGFNRKRRKGVRGGAAGRGRNSLEDR